MNERRWAVVLVVLTIGVWHGVAALGWTGFDDTVYVSNNPHMTAQDGLRRIWTTNESEQYYPLTFTAYWLQYRFFGASATGYHVVSLALHVANVLLLISLLRAMRFSPRPSWVAAALFAVHPTQVMSVAWIAEQKNLLATLFMLLACIAWIRANEPPLPRARAWYAASIAFFALGMLSKTAVLGLPVALLVMNRCVLGAPWRLRRALPMLLCAAALAALTIAFEERFAGERTPSWKIPLAERLQIAGAAPWAYLGRLLWPVGLSPAYELWSVTRASLLWWMPLLLSVASAAALVAAWRARRIGGHWAWGATHFVVLIGPTLGIVAFANLSVSHTSDHFLYPASLSLFAAGTVALEGFSRRGPTAARALRVASFVAIAACAVLTMRQVPVYRSAETLWTRAVAMAPDSYAAHIGLAESLRSRGKDADAMREYGKALELRPGWVDGYALMGDAQTSAGDLEGAEASYRKALEVAPDNPSVVANLAGILERRRKLEEALALYERAVRIEPSHLHARIGLAQMYLGYRRYEDALGQFRAALALERSDARLHVGVVTCLQRLGRDAEAAAAAEHALSVVMDHPAVLNALARVLASSPDPRVRDPKKAITTAERAVVLMGSGNYEVLETLAMAQAAASDFARAAATATRAAEIASKAGDERFAAAMRARAQEYAAGKSP